MDQTMRMRALTIIGEQVGIDPNKLDEELRIDEDLEREKVTIQTLGADSLDCVEIGLELEEEFDIELPDEAVTTDLSLKQVLAMVQEKWEA